MLNQNLTFSLMMTLLVGSQSVWANSSEQTAIQANKIDHSISGFKRTLVDSELNTEKLLAETDTTQRTKKHQGMQRDAVNFSRQEANKAAAPDKTGKAKIQLARAVNFDHSFSIYSGYSQLITDIDADGYYQTFSVSFDADILSSFSDEQALVYADLYLSKDGGPWVLYFSTDDFVITGESTDDEFEVVTQLDSGYVPDNYNVLIDLYEVGYGDIVATYSSNDSNTLYALPLESSDYDPEYYEVEYDEHGGGVSWFFLSLLLILVARRR
jgi:hypothetical protein